MSLNLRVGQNIDEGRIKEIVAEAVKARKFSNIDTLRMGIEIIEMGMKWRTENEEYRADMMRR